MKSSLSSIFTWVQRSCVGLRSTALHGVLQLSWVLRVLADLRAAVFWQQNLRRA
jgi:hypothetical protein